MARSVVAGHPLTTGSKFLGLFGLPHLSELALPIYSKLFPERLNKFPQPLEDQVYHLVIIPKEIRINKESRHSLPWTQTLHHDGESVFWLLVWWAIHLRPRSASSSKISNIIFGFLTNIDPVMKHDARMVFMETLTEGISWMDPEYQELEPLFLRMARHLMGDLYWAKYGGTGEMKEPEFLHEALQRIIFDFLMKNKTKPFMKLEKDPRPREVEYRPRRHAEGQVTHSKRTYSTMANDSETECEVTFVLTCSGAHNLLL